MPWCVKWNKDLNWTEILAWVALYRMGRFKYADSRAFLVHSKVKEYILFSYFILFIIRSCRIYRRKYYIFMCVCVYIIIVLMIIFSNESALKFSSVWQFPVLKKSPPANFGVACFSEFSPTNSLPLWESSSLRAGKMAAGNSGGDFLKTGKWNTPKFSPQCNITNFSTEPNA